MQSIHSEKSRRSWWPLLVVLPPIAAVLGSMVTMYVSSRHPDQVIPVTQVKEHVTNSVVPPLR